MNSSRGLADRPRHATWMQLHPEPQTGSWSDPADLGNGLGISNIMISAHPPRVRGYKQGTQSQPAGRKSIFCSASKRACISHEELQ